MSRYTVAAVYAPLLTSTLQVSYGHSISPLRPKLSFGIPGAYIWTARSIALRVAQTQRIRSIALLPSEGSCFPALEKQPNGRAEGMTRSAKKDRDEGGKWRGQNTMRDGSHDGSPSLASVRTAGVRPAVQSAVCHLCFSSLFPILFLLQFPFNRERYKQSDADAQGDAEPGGGIMF